MAGVGICIMCVLRQNCVFTVYLVVIYGFVPVTYLFSYYVRNLVRRSEALYMLDIYLVNAMNEREEK